MGTTPNWTIEHTMNKKFTYKEMTFLEGETVLAPRHHGSSPDSKEEGVFASMHHGFAMIRFHEQRKDDVLVKPADTLHIPVRMVEHIAK